MQTSPQDIKARVGCHGPNHVNKFIICIDNAYQFTHAKHRRSEKDKTKKSTAQIQAQARPKVRPLVLGGVLIRRDATDPLEEHALKKVDLLR